VQERLAVTLRFWATDDWRTVCNIFFQISKQTIGQIICLDISNVNVLMENVEEKIVYCKDQNILHRKSMGWNTEKKYITNRVLLISEL
jgi:hypothetical protein